MSIEATNSDCTSIANPSNRHGPPDCVMVEMRGSDINTPTTGSDTSQSTNRLPPCDNGSTTATSISRRDPPASNIGGGTVQNYIMPPSSNIGSGEAHSYFREPRASTGISYPNNDPPCSDITAPRYSTAVESPADDGTAQMSGYIYNSPGGNAGGCASNTAHEPAGDNFTSIYSHESPYCYGSTEQTSTSSRELQTSSILSSYNTSFGSPLTSAVSTLNGDSENYNYTLRETNRRLTRDLEHLQAEYTKLKNLNEAEGRQCCPHYCTSGLQITTDNHYIPRRGLVIPKANYVLINEGQSLPPQYEILANSTMAVPTQWLSLVLGKCKNKPPSFVLKKMMDGLFEPEELSGKSSNAFAGTQTQAVVTALTLFGINKLRMTAGEFTHAFNSKCATCKRAVCRSAATS
ncbi:uncharacterized protein [Ptychodera flava]|uniref:uncharacterized protein n=1 Tax=Ptychodera flava TaxID=63121 RepID=UPI00396A10DE